MDRVSTVIMVSLVISVLGAVILALWYIASLRFSPRLRAQLLGQHRRVLRQIQRDRELANRRARFSAPGVRRCRICGYTEDHSYVTAFEGMSRHWVEEDLCSACDAEIAELFDQ